MHAFEQIVARLLEAEGYWTRVGFYVDLTKDEKREAGKPSMPRPQIDVIAFNPKANELLLIECKSFLDSRGVMLSGFHGKADTEKDVYKLFNRIRLRTIVTRAIVRQLRRDGLVTGRPHVRLGLVAGKVYSNDEAALRDLFAARGWIFIGPREVAEKLRTFAERGYEDDVATIVTKILERNSAGAR